MDGMRSPAIGVAHDLHVDPVTGSLATTIALDLPSARAGFGPRLQLEYSSGRRNSAFGVGWQLGGLLSIGVDTTEGLPRYDESDNFVHAASGQLVPVISDADGDAGAWDDRGSYLARSYRARFEQDHHRVEQCVEKSTGRVYWHSWDATGAFTLYGKEPDGRSRIANPEDPRQIFQWLPDFQCDSMGNAIAIEYLPEDRAGVDAGDPSEAGRMLGGLAQRYLKRLRWGNVVPVSQPGPDPAGQRWCFELVFDYGDHDQQPPVPDANRSWERRPDPFSICTPCFDLRTYRLCRRILLFHHFNELAPEPVIVRCYEFKHDLRPEGSMLTQVRLVGFRQMPGGTTTSKTQPPLSLTYSEPRVAAAFQATPAETSDALPSGLDGPNFRWVDLLGEGLPGILVETGDAWYFKRNEGGGKFGREELAVERPAYPLAQVAIQDFDGDGNPDLAVVGSRGAGYYAFDRMAQQWNGFRPFASIPHLDEAGARAQWLDLDGDGRPELLLGESDRLTYFRSLGKEGFDTGIQLQPMRGSQDAVLSAPIADDPSIEYFFADMNGDGLADQVLVRNGLVCYWPNLGHGRFGAPVVMDGAPQLAPQGELDPSRLLFADLDGSGTADLLYLADGEITYWTNASGNRLLEGRTFGGLPYIDNVAMVRVLDFLGDGTPCLVWSNPLPGRGANLQYLRLTDGVRCGLLTGTNNGAGLARRVEYDTSASHYLADRASGVPWRTLLPAHVTVVERLELIDEIGGARSEMRYAYHDGSFDSEERRFVGFGCVETFDSEEPSPSATGPASEPSCTRIFTHLGTQGTPSLGRAWRGDAGGAAIEPHVFAAGQTLSEVELAEGLAAVAGRVVRAEIFALASDGGIGAHPFRVEQSGFEVVRVQRASDTRHASFAVIEKEQLSAAYEQQADDPRITHHVVLENDDYGVPSLACQVAYPRRATIAAADPGQCQTVARVERARTLHIDNPDRHQLGIGFEHETFDLAGLAPPTTGAFTSTELERIVLAAIANPSPHDVAGIPAGAARRTGWTRTFYWNNGSTAADSLGSAGFPVRVHHIEQAAFSTGFADSLYGDWVDATILRAQGYRQEAGHWWRIGETLVHGDAAAFYRLEQINRPDGGLTRFVYDPSGLFVVETTDAAGNRVRVTQDYQSLAAARTTDENNHICEITYDALGVPVAATNYGEVLDDSGVVRPYGFDPVAALGVRRDATIESALADPAGHIQGAAEATVYDVDRWRSRLEPPVVVRLSREMLTQNGDGRAVDEGNVVVSVTHLDGFGRALQEKLRVEDGPAIRRGADGRVAVDEAGRPVLAHAAERWLVGGHTVYNAKQETARRYEPYFSPGWRFEPDDELARFGVAQSYYYDALGRELRHEYPNGTLAHVEYGAWATRSYDANDTVSGSLYELSRASLPAGDSEREALERARAHAETPIVRHCNPEGSEVLREETSGLGQQRSVRTTYTSRGDVATMTDPRGIVAVRTTFDMLGRAIRTESVDAGSGVVFLDAMDRPCDSWRNGTLHIRSTFDTLDRLHSVHVDGGPGLNRRAREFLYGDDPSVVDAVARNARGRLVRCRDEAGEQTIEQYTPGGEVLASTRRFMANPDILPDWRNPASVTLLAGEFVTRFAYDGLGRPLRQTLAEGTTVTRSFTRAGQPRHAAISSSDGLLDDIVLFHDACYNARGQREAVELGNGVRISHEFDPDTWRTRRVLAERGPAKLQDIEYTYDPVGNIVRSLDRAQEPGAAGSYLHGLNTSAVRTFRYDGFYQLREAAGRVHRAALPDDHRTDPANAGSFKGARRLSLNDGGLLERYVQTFEYDLAGNMTRQRHQGVAVNWTRDFWVSAASNRSLPAMDANGMPLVNPEEQFDASGNCLYLPHLRRMEWDYRGLPSRAVIVDRGGAEQPDDDERYVYDGGGNRVRKLTRRLLADGVVETTDVLYLDGCEIRRIRRDATDVLERRTAHVGDGLNRIALVHRWTLDTGAREVDDTTQPRIHYQLSDHLGSATLQLDGNGNVIAFEEYFPFGDTAFIAGDDAREVALRSYRYCGKERDDATSLYYFGHRYYVPWLGRWLCPDPAGPVDGLNLYQYALNNPITNFDPDGLHTGRIVPVAGPVPSDVNVAFRAQTQAEQKRLFGLIRQNNFFWYRDGAKGRVYFGTSQEIRRRVQAQLSAGIDVGQLQTSAPPTSKGKGGGGGGRAARRPTAEVPSTPGRGGGRGSGGHAGSTTSLPPDGTAGKAPGADGACAGSNGTGGANDPGATAVNAGDGATKGAPPGPSDGGGGTGTSGSGPGAKAQSNRSGTGGGGTADGPEAIGNGTEGSGPGDVGPGEDRSVGHGGGGGCGKAGGQDEGDSVTGVVGDRGVAGDRSGQAAGGAAGVAEGAPNGGLTGAPGPGNTSGSPGNTATPTGDPHGSRGGCRRRGERTEGGVAEEPGGQRGGGRRQQPTLMDRIAHYAGWWHLQFGGAENNAQGQSGGIPGGMGATNLGGYGQSAFVALTIADIVFTVLSLGGLAAMKAGLRLTLAAARRVLEAAGRRIASAWARRTAALQFLRATAARLLRTMSSGLRQWFCFWDDKGGAAIGRWSAFYAIMRTTIHNHDWAMGRIIGGIDTAVHESVHWVMNWIPWWTFLQLGLKPRGQPIGAGLMWAEETIAYALGRASTLRVHGIVAAPLEAFRSVAANYGGGPLGARAQAWAAAEILAVVAAVAAYFALYRNTTEAIPAQAP